MATPKAETKGTEAFKQGADVPHILQIIPKIREELGAVGKDEAPVSGPKYKYRSADTVINAIVPLFNKYGVFTTVEDEALHYGTEQVGSKFLTRSQIAKKVTFYASSDGSSVSSVVVAESQDWSDKASGAAGTYAYRVALTQTFTIPTGDDPDQKYEEFTVPAGAPQKSAPATNPAVNVNVLKAKVSELLGTRDRTEITKAGDQFFGGKPGWAESADALQKWVDALTVGK